MIYSVSMLHTNTAGDCLSNEQEASMSYLWLAIPMRVNAGDSIPIFQKEMEAPKDCGCKEREKF